MTDQIIDLAEERRRRAAEEEDVAMILAALDGFVVRCEDAARQLEENAARIKALVRRSHFERTFPDR